MAEPNSNTISSSSTQDQADPFVKQYNPFQHPLVWCLQEYLQQQQKAGGGGEGGAASPQQQQQHVYVKTQELEAASKVRCAGQCRRTRAFGTRRDLPSCINITTAHNCTHTILLHNRALQVLEQRRKLPPVVNDKALFTRAAPFGDRADQAYHAPSNKIGAYLSPASAHAAALLFEEFPQVRQS